MILIVDDTPEDLELTTIALEATAREISIRSATSGMSALAMLRNGDRLPDLILLDFKMPKMSGIDVIREIRADDRLREIPVVVLSSSIQETDNVAAIAAGANGYIQKPFDLHQYSKDLESILHRWLSNCCLNHTEMPVSFSI